MEQVRARASRRSFCWISLLFRAAFGTIYLDGVVPDNEPGACGSDGGGGGGTIVAAVEIATVMDREAAALLRPVINQYWTWRSFWHWERTARYVPST